MPAIPRDGIPPHVAIDLPLSCSTPRLQSKPPDASETAIGPKNSR